MPHDLLTSVHCNVYIPPPLQMSKPFSSRNNKLVGQSGWTK